MKKPRLKYEWCGYKRSHVCDVEILGNMVFSKSKELDANEVCFGLVLVGTALFIIVVNGFFDELQSLSIRI